MIIENIALANKRTEPSLLNLACIVLHCVLAREHESCAHSRSPPNPSENEDQGDYAYYEDPEVGGQGNDEE